MYLEEYFDADVLRRIPLILMYLEEYFGLF
jgi:hypothetical protein